MSYTDDMPADIKTQYRQADQWAALFDRTEEYFTELHSTGQPGPKIRHS